MASKIKNTCPKCQSFCSNKYLKKNLMCGKCYIAYTKEKPEINDLVILQNIIGIFDITEDDKKTSQIDRLHKINLDIDEYLTNLINALSLSQDSSK